MTNLMLEVRDGNVEDALKRFKRHGLKAGLFRELQPGIN